MNKHSPTPDAGAAARSVGVPLAWAELAAGAVVLVLMLGALHGALAWPLGAAGLALAVYAAMAGLVWRYWPDAHRGLGPANRVTLLRGTLVAILAGALAGFPVLAGQAGRLAPLALGAVGLDGVVGWAARRWRCASAFGARFDMELDAFLILVLCGLLLAQGKAGAWVLAIGAMRYVFVAAMAAWPWLEAPLPERWRRKAVCVWQVASLLLCLLPQVGASLAGGLLGLALVLLGWSFAVDVRWLYRHRPRP
jgi:phosphatidylglycerophosphate synthase